jgi:hypothetical protein
LNNSLRKYPNQRSDEDAKTTFISELSEREICKSKEIHRQECNYVDIEYVTLT